MKDVISLAKAKNDLAKLEKSLRALNDGCLERGDITYGEQEEFQKLTLTFNEIRRSLGADINVVKAVLPGRVVTSADYKTHLGLTVESEGLLPIDILDILERNCPVHGSPKKVKDTHLLAWIPNNINLEMLSHAVGGEDLLLPTSMSESS